MPITIKHQTLTAQRQTEHQDFCVINLNRRKLIFNCLICLCYQIVSYIYQNEEDKIQFKRMQNRSIERITADIQDMVSSIQTSHLSKIPSDLMYLIQYLKSFILLPEVKLIPFKQKVASLINYFMIQAGITLNLKESGKVLFQLFFNWKMPFSAKILLKRAFLRMLLSLYEDDMRNDIIRENNSFQQTTMVLARMMEFIDTNYSQQQMSFESSLIDSQFFQTPALITIQMPQDASEVYQTILFIIESIVVDLPQDQPYKSSKLNMLKALRIIQNIVITQENMRFRINIIQYIIQIWEGVCDHFFDPDSHQQQNTLQLVIEVDKWLQLTQKFQMIYRSKASLTYSQDIDQGNLHCYNYLAWNEQLETSLYSLKIQAARVHVNLLIILMHNHSENKSLLIIQLNSIIKELLHTLKYLAQNYTLLRQTHSQLAQKFISLLGIYLQVNQISFQQMLMVLNSILIPIISQQIEAKRKVYDEQPLQLFQQLQSCFSNHQFESILSEISKIIELMVDKDQNIFIFIVQYFRYSLEYNQKSLSETIPPQMLIMKPMEVSSALFILSVISYEVLKHQQLKQILQKLIVQELYFKLNDYQRVYFFTSMTVHWPALYSNNYEQGIYLFQVVVDSHSSQSLKLFALDFVVNVCEYYFCEPFLEAFIRKFTKIQNFQEKWTILGKIIKKFIDRISDDTICSIAMIMRLQAQQQMHILLSKIQRGERNYTTNHLLNYISICKIIAQQGDHCRGKPHIQNQLFLLIQNIEDMNKLYLDDEILRLADCLLDQYTVLPNEYLPFLLKVGKVCLENQYQGVQFFAIFNKFTILSGDSLEMRSQLYNILMGGLAYFAHYPDDDPNIGFSIDEQINNQLILMSNYLLVHGDKMKSTALHQLNQVANIIQEKISQRSNVSSFTLLNARNRIIQIICCFYLKQPICLQKLLTESQNRIYHQFDAFILIYVLTQVNTTFRRREQKKMILKILLNLLRRANQNQMYTKEQFNNPTFIQDEQLKPFNDILCYVEPVVRLECTIKEQIIQFFNQCFKRRNIFQEIILAMEQKDYQELSPLIKYRKYDPFSGVNTQNIGKYINVTDRINYIQLMKKKQFDALGNMDQMRYKPIKRTFDHFQYKIEEEHQMFGSKRRYHSDQALETNMLQRVYQKQMQKQQKIQH